MQRGTDTGRKGVARRVTLMWGVGDGANGEANKTLKKPESRPNVGRIPADRPTLLHC